MDKNKIAGFFDRCAPWWDADMIRNEAVITKILDNGGIRENIDVLDVACGTGVLFPDYFARKVASLTGIDISPEMAKLAAAKFPQAQVICGDVEQTVFDRQFDAIMVYNAFPHFPDPENLVRVLAGLCKEGGRLSIAHGMSRAALADHHAGRAAEVSIDLLHEQELAAIMDRWFEVDVIISDDSMYQVCGVRRAGEKHSHGGVSHVHSHDHDHSHDSMQELVALAKYMVAHNDAHAQELAELADRLKAAGKDRAYRQVMDAVSEFDIANAKLSAALKLIEE